MKQVLCQVGENTYGIDIEKVQGIEKDLNIVPVPNVSPLVEGIANLRGLVVPVISLRKKFNVTEKPVTDEKNYIITKLEGMLVGFRVDTVAEIVEVGKKDIYEAPVIVMNENTSYVDSIIRVNQKLVLVLNMEGILDEVEQKKIKQLLDEQ